MSNSLTSLSGNFTDLPYNVIQLLEAIPSLHGLQYMFEYNGPNNTRFIRTPDSTLPLTPELVLAGTLMACVGFITGFLLVMAVPWIVTSTHSRCTRVHRWRQSITSTWTWPTWPRLVWGPSPGARTSTSGISTAPTPPPSRATQQTPPSSQVGSGNKTPRPPVPSDRRLSPAKNGDQDQSSDLSTARNKDVYVDISLTDSPHGSRKTVQDSSKDDVKITMTSTASTSSKPPVVSSTSSPASVTTSSSGANQRFLNNCRIFGISHITGSPLSSAIKGKSTPGLKTKNSSRLPRTRACDDLASLGRAGSRRRLRTNYSSLSHSVLRTNQQARRRWFSRKLGWW